MQTSLLVTVLLRNNLIENVFGTRLERVRKCVPLAFHLRSAFTGTQSGTHSCYYFNSSHFHALVRPKVTKVFVSCYISVQWIRSHPVYFDSLLSCSDFLRLRCYSNVSYVSDKFLGGRRCLVNEYDVF